MRLLNINVYTNKYNKRPMQELVVLRRSFFVQFLKVLINAIRTIDELKIHKM